MAREFEEGAVLWRWRRKLHSWLLHQMFSSGERQGGHRTFGDRCLILDREGNHSCWVVLRESRRITTACHNSQSVLTEYIYF